MNAAGRREAMRAVEVAVARFVAASQAERLRLYRLHLQTSVTRISPLALDLAADCGLVIATFARMLPVPRHWPAGASASHTRRIKGGPLPIARTRFTPPVSAATRLRLGRSGLAVRGREDPRGDLGFVPEDDVLEAVAHSGKTTLHTGRGFGYVVTGRTLPDAVLTALEGRRIETAVSHPCLAGRDYLIEAAFNDEFMDGSVLKFRTGLVPIVLPWADDLAREIRGGMVPPATDEISSDDPASLRAGEAGGACGRGGPGGLGRSGG